MAEPTEAAKKLLAEAAADYASRSGADPYSAAESKTTQVMGQLAAQRAAAIKWSEPPEAKPGDRDKS